MRLRMEEIQEVGCRGGVAFYMENTTTTFLEKSWTSIRRSDSTMFVEE